MKKINLTIAFLLICTWSALCQEKISFNVEKDYYGRNIIVAKSKDDVYSYEAKVFYKNRLLESAIVSAGQTHTFTKVNASKKSMLKHLSYSSAINAKTIASDVQKVERLAATLRYQADNKPSECWRTVYNRIKVEIGFSTLFEILFNVSICDSFWEKLAKLARMGNMNKDDLAKEIKEINELLPTASKKEYDCLIQTRSYYFRLYDALDEPFKKCPALQTEQENLYSQARGLEQIKELVKRKEHYESPEGFFWDQKATRALARKKLAGLSIRVQQQSLLSNELYSNGFHLTQVKESKTNNNYEISVLAPLSRKLRSNQGFTKGLFFVGTVGQSNTSFTPNKANWYLGVMNNQTKAIEAIDKTNTLNISTQYAGLGLHYQIAVGRKLSFGVEGGAVFYYTNDKPSFSNSNFFQSDGSKIWKAPLEASSKLQESRLISDIPVDRYFKLQVSTPLISFGGKKFYPYRKNLMLCLDAGVRVVSNNSNTLQSQSLQIIEAQTTGKVLSNQKASIGSSAFIGLGLQLNM